MRAVLVLLGLVALVAAYPQEGGGDHHKHHEEHHGHAISWMGLERKDKHEDEVHIKAHPEYKYGFKVEDDKHHDYHSKKEEREGYKVKGQYKLLEADGKTIRIVDYTSDKKEGFNAKVTFEHHH